ncbi:MAG: putative manganese-dependent inorganic diphosphatase [Eubacteriales bacterium]
MDNIYVFGHRNPDTDSICSAIAYSYLKKQLGHDNIIPARLGAPNKETLYVLNYFDVELPILIEEIKMQVKDLFLRPIEAVKKDASIMKVADITVNKNKHLTPVVDSVGRLIGVITLPDLYPNLIGTVCKDSLKETKTPFNNIVDVLEADKLYGEYSNEYIKGEVYTLSETTTENHLNNGDIIIVGENNNYIQRAFKSGASCVIVSTKDKANCEIDIPNEYNGVVLLVESSIFNIVKLISKTVPIESMVNKKMLEYFDLNDSIEEVKEQIIASNHRSFPVVDERGRIKGLLSRSDLLKVNRKKVILVDHNEYGQSIKGIEETDIIEVIDHHRIANIQTMAPLYFRAEPVGCTATIILSLYEEHKIEIPKHIAGIMLSSILSDTLLFNSPTCTEQDKKAAEKLGEIAEVNIEKYGMDMIIAGTAIGNETAEDIITKDMKHFIMGKYRVMISQINTGDFRGISNLLPTLREKVEEICKEEEIDLVVLMVTNIIIGGSEIIIYGKEKWIARNAFKIRAKENSIYLSGVFSRKKQIVPALMNAAQL